MIDQIYVVLDETDSRECADQIRALHGFHAGRIVVRPTALVTPRALGHNMLRALGKRLELPESRPWRSTFDAVSLWLAAEQVRHLYVLRAHLLDGEAVRPSPRSWIRLLPWVTRRSRSTAWCDYLTGARRRSRAPVPERDPDGAASCPDVGYWRGIAGCAEVADLECCRRAVGSRSHRTADPLAAMRQALWRTTVLSLAATGAARRALFEAIEFQSAADGPPAGFSRPLSMWEIQVGCCERGERLFLARARARA